MVKVNFWTCSVKQWSCVVSRKLAGVQRVNRLEQDMIDDEC